MNEVTPRSRRSPSRSALLAAALLAALSLGVASVGACATVALAQQEGSGDSTRKVERPGRTNLPLPRFVSLRSTEVNLRRGPGTRYPIDWVYRRRDLPVEVVDEFDAWRQIRDHDGTIGWVHQSMIQGERYLMVVGERRALRRGPDEGARVLALLDPGVLCRLVRCENDWCSVEVARFEGWLKRSETFGTYPDESFP
jgi:SH3-like domain-containing protein